MAVFVDWDQTFMTMVFSIAMKSKDESSQVGAVIVTGTHPPRIVSVGFNGLPQGLKETPERKQRPLKYSVCEHSERNSIYSAARLGVKLEGCKMYTSATPCVDCARGIIQSGITEVIVSKYCDQIFAVQPQWKESLRISQEMFEECGVKLRVYEGKIITEISNICAGQPIQF